MLNAITSQAGDINPATPTAHYHSILAQYLAPDSQVDWDDAGIAIYQIPNPSPGLQANSYYFNHPEWAKNYLQACHRDSAFKERWQAAIESWDDKVVVDIGCGPGNLYATLGGSPRVLIGVDVAHGALKMAQQLGYIPVIADAQHLPFITDFADIVTINASLHHCDIMETALEQAARLVRPGGLLVVDHDPQRTAWDFKGLGMALYKTRLLIYRLLGNEVHIPFNIPQQERSYMMATELHHKPGDGVTPKFFYQTLKPLGFTVELHPHNHSVGAEALQGNYGRSHLKYRLGQRLSGINPNSSEAALSLMCIARRNA